MSLQQAEAHQRRHGFNVEGLGSVKTAEKAPGDSRGILARPVKMTRPEKEYGLILEAMKRKGEIVDYKFQGMSLAWGADPETGRIMRYKCDWLVIGDTAYKPMDGAITSEFKNFAALKLIEVKGGGPYAVHYQAVVRFKGCRAEWPMFQFEMHQLEKGVWRRVQ